jgi:hypothetical protein
MKRSFLAFVIFFSSQHCSWIKNKFFSRSSNSDGLIPSSSATGSLDYTQNHTNDTLLWRSNDLNENRTCYYRDFIEVNVGGPYEGLSNSRPLTKYSINSEELVTDLSTTYTDLPSSEISLLLNESFFDFSPRTTSEFESVLASTPSPKKRKLILLLLPQRFSPESASTLLQQHANQSYDHDKLSMLLQALYQRFLKEDSQSEETDFLCDPDSTILAYLATHPEKKSGTVKLHNLKDKPCNQIQCPKLFVRDDRSRDSDEYALIYCQALRSDKGCVSPECQPCPLGSADQLSQCLMARKACPGYENILQTLDF